MARNNAALWIGGGVVLAGVALVAASAGNSPTVQTAVRDAGREAVRTARRLEETAVDLVTDWITTLLRKTAAHEGYYWSVNPNRDGQGVSYGILQWTQRKGGLYGVLSAMRAADAGLFDAAFDGSENAIALLAHTRAMNMGKLNGAYLWEQPWLGRFYRAGGGPMPPRKVAELPAPSTPLQSAMYYHAAGSDYMKGAIEIARALDATTERGLTLCYNRTVHQGVGGATWALRKLLAQWERNPSSRAQTVNDRLAQYAWTCAAAFRSTTARSGNYNDNGTIQWQPVATELTELHQGDYSTRRVNVSNVWHGVGGMGSLYDLITMRSSSILLDPTLRDAPADLGGIA